MINVYNFEDKTAEDCRMKCLEELDVYDDEIITREFEEDGNYHMEVIKIDDIKSYVKEYLTTLLSKMNIKSTVTVYEDEKIFTVKIKSNDNRVLIGKDGKNLSAIQFMARQVVRNMTNFNIKINLDISNYREKKEKFFESDIKKIINEVLSSKTDTKLDPMNSYQRRLVHNVANNYYNIETESVGEEPNRCVTIKYVEN